MRQRAVIASAGGRLPWLTLHGVRREEGHCAPVFGPNCVTSRKTTFDASWTQASRPQDPRREGGSEVGRAGPPVARAGSVPRQQRSGSEQRRAAPVVLAHAGDAPDLSLTRCTRTGRFAAAEPRTYRASSCLSPRAGSGPSGWRGAAVVDRWAPLACQASGPTTCWILLERGPSHGPSKVVADAFVPWWAALVSGSTLIRHTGRQRPCVPGHVASWCASGVEPGPVATSTHGRRPEDGRSRPARQPVMPREVAPKSGRQTHTCPPQDHHRLALSTGGVDHAPVGRHRPAPQADRHVEAGLLGQRHEVVVGRGTAT